MNKNKLLVHRTSWDDATATSREWWELYELRRGWFTGLKWRPVKVDLYAGDGIIYKDTASGNREWAEKIAKHYGIKIPEK